MRVLTKAHGLLVDKSIRVSYVVYRALSIVGERHSVILLSFVASPYFQKMCPFYLSGKKIGYIAL